MTHDPLANASAPTPHNAPAPFVDWVPPPKAKKSWYKRWWVWLIVFVFAVGVLGNLLEGEPELVEIPDVVGLPGDDAKDALKDIGLEGKFSDDSDQGRSVLSPSNWEVARTDPAAGEVILEGEIIDVYAVKASDAEDAAKAEAKADAKAEKDAKKEAEAAAAVKAKEAEAKAKKADDQAKADTAAATLGESNASQFLAHAWEAKFIYGGKVHWIADRITTENDDGTYTFKIGATMKNEYGTKMKATVEGDVGGTNDAPKILDSIMYNSAGEIINYY